MKASDIYPPSWINVQPLDAGKPDRCSDCGVRLNSRHRAPHVMWGDLCAYFCDPCADDWLGPFEWNEREG